MKLDLVAVLRLTATVSATLVMAGAASWGAFALWYQAPGGQLSKTLCVLLWMSLNVFLIYALWQGRIAVGLLTFALAFAVLLIWWQRIEPSNDRVWADDVSHMTTGSVQGDRVVLRDVRNFDWRSEHDYTQRWEVREYDLSRLKSVDMIMSYWSGKAIAHMLVSFGFEGADQVAFSVEIRREKNESFSEIGGFFKEFELSILAADERDVIRLRTNIRGEDDYLYRLRLRPDEIRSLFLAYIDEANSLVHTPRYYNTVTVNCTTLVYHMMKRIVGYLPLSYRVLFSGYLPGYVYEVGGLDRSYTLEQLESLGRITERAKASDRSESFSADIRRGIPD